MYVSNTRKIQPKTTPSGATVWWLLAEEDGAPHFEMRYFEIAPGRNITGTPPAGNPWGSCASYPRAARTS